MADATEIAPEGEQPPARGMLGETRDSITAVFRNRNMRRIQLALAGSEVGDWAYAEAGATAIFEAQPFERRFRDLHAAGQQVQGRASHLEEVGRHLLGLPPNLRFL